MRTNRRGFTLLEILVASAMVGMLLIALNTFIFSMAELWGARRDERNFDLHVGNVTRFMEREMRSVTLPPYGSLSSPGLSWQTPTVQSGSPGSSNAGDQVLSFTLPSESRLLPWPARALPDVACALVVRDGQGLVLQWHSQYETTFATDAPRESVISPLVTAMQYDYFDTTQQQWTTTDQPQIDPTSNLPQVPSRLRLTFTYGNLSQVTVVSLPVAAQGLPSY